MLDATEEESESDAEKAESESEEGKSDIEAAIQVETSLFLNGFC